MFIGGLNWETTDQSLKDYFSQFGDVLECTVMRDGATGRSRGFGFLTFKDPKTVNIVMVKEHYLDGKIIDPKRAIPREEQERTAKIFVGGVSQECTEHHFKEFFMQFGRVVDATLMMDKDTGRPRGFGFVTFDGEEAVDKTLSQPLSILNKMIEVKRAEPRGNMHDDKGGKFGRRGDRFGRGANDNNQAQGNFGNDQELGNAQGTSGMTPTQIARYWYRMQEYFRMMQQQIMANNMANQGQGAMPMMGGMNPAMMQQMASMNPAMMQQMAAMQGQNPAGGAMNPAMMQQMQQHMQQQQAQQQSQQQQQQQTQQSSYNPAMEEQGPIDDRPGFSAHEQLAFEQQKYERQQAHRMQQYNSGQGSYGQGGPASWDGMYDEVPAPTPPPAGPSRGSSVSAPSGYARGGHSQRGSKSIPPPAQPSNAPANAPTGPKNAGKPGANYRGGGRGSHRGYHPYAR
ncbi:RNA-binding domain-containing protein [Trichodelitschia bisporula]|uniref:RNA-binding domain-containing protein n=1 Tax=Trichodelitschia bisporula TaxID=703511 RepID=A0A6G1I3B6_9PEZI|nr:RNA-binding domain-containing protein [Trichodelitschia bisporula]